MQGLPMELNGVLSQQELQPLSIDHSHASEIDETRSRYSLSFPKMEQQLTTESSHGLQRSAVKQ